MIVIVFLTVLGLAIAHTGLRARSVPCDPVCARCGYDLRGYDVLNNCSECGNNLTAAGSIRRFTDHSSRRVVVFGLIVAVAPWSIVGYELLQRRYGYDLEKLRTNSDLISVLSKPSGQNKTSIWRELGNRLGTGRLPAADASPLVDQLTKTIQSGQNSFDPLMHSRWFFLAADKAGAISSAQYQALARAFYEGPASQGLYTPHVPSEIHANQPTTHYLFSDTLGDLPGFQRIAVPLKVELSRPGSPPIDVMDARPGTLRAKDAPPGPYDLTFAYRIFLVHGSRPLTVATLPPGAAPVAQWDISLKATVEVVAYTQGRTGNRIPALRTDDAADPQKAGSLTMEPAYELCFTDRTLLLINFKVSNPPENLYFKAVVHIGQRTILGGWSFILRGNGANGLHQVHCDLGHEHLDPAQITVEFQPDWEHAKNSMLNSVWNKTLRFENVAMKRRDLNHKFPSPATTQTKPASH